MEMNTRIQVEHTITEQITGIDIVQEQLRIAAGAPLNFSQETSQLPGLCHAAADQRGGPQERLSAEFRSHHPLLCTGRARVRVDTAIYTGYEIPPFYDSMCLKLIVWALDWESLLARAQRAIDDMRLHGIRTTANYYQQILKHPDFRSREFDTSFVANHPELSRYSDKKHPSDVALALAAAIAAYAGISN